MGIYDAALAWVRQGTILTISLRARLIIGLAWVLLASLVLGSVLVCAQASYKVDTEMRAAIDVGERTVRVALGEAQGAADPWPRLTQLVAGLDGSRHLQATLLDARGAVRARSQPLQPGEPAPAWFYKLLAYRERQLRLPAGPDGAILLRTDAHNEIGEVWSSALLMFGTLFAVCCLNAVLVSWLAGSALGPLTQVLAACARIGRGDYGLSIAERGARELVELVRGFNRMAGELAALAARQGRLEEQLVQVQEEERAELARDLHDEVGPLLFAVSVDLAALTQEETLSGSPALQARLGAAGEAVARMQHEVRGMLGRLRPPSVTDLGLSHSIERLAAFWQARYPQVTFEVTVLTESLSADLGTRIYRIVQESISNAVRHGRPRRIEVSVGREGRDSIRVQVRDDGIGLCAPSSGGLGLTGMRERVVASGGELEVRSGEQGRGVVVSARLPDELPAGKVVA
jgi:two-component system sensor histidine kinase UhpB